MTRWLTLLLAIPLLLAQPQVARPKILGVAHVAFFVSDLAKARAFYQGLLGYDEPFTLPNPDGSIQIAFVKINDRQWIELFTGPPAGEGQLNHIALYTDDAERMRTYLASRGVAVPATVAKGRTGNKNFMIKDPDGHNVEIVEYQPDSWTAKDTGLHLPAGRIADRALHLGILVGEPGEGDDVLHGRAGIRGVLARRGRQFDHAELGEHARAGRDRLSGVHALRAAARSRTIAARNTTCA